MLSGCGPAPAPLAPYPDASALPGADVGRGRQWVAQAGCAACHSVPGVRSARAQVGPPLHDLHRRVYLGGVLPNTPENLVRWLADPRAHDAATAMPAVGLTPQQARDIAAYLLAQP
ncbi:c-type cytochrome [Bordetella genomosp. 1]|uniref:Cytochrome c domain-containing protein n=1 Tax=Bordetella genomosp. 1 TaxID=1395607 RepID=A0ABX4F0V2_9BORD|nr:c-type cytochrome [Bordetella genomosp. 1]OZI63974.1 hypothetical protein CAL27_15415 [Bordetella genomosp. 1]